MEVPRARSWDCVAVPASPDASAGAALVEVTAWLFLVLSTASLMAFEVACWAASTAAQAMMQMMRPAMASPLPERVRLKVDTSPTMAKSAPSRARKNEPLLKMGIQEVASATIPSTSPTIAMAEGAGLPVPRASCPFISCSACAIMAPFVASDC